VVLYALSAVYFAGVMVRLMLTLTPAVCILGGIAFSKIFENYLKEESSVISNDNNKMLDEKPAKDKTPSKSSQVNTFIDNKFMYKSNVHVVFLNLN